MGNERINLLIEEELQYLTKSINEAKHVIPILQDDVKKELYDKCIDIIERLGDFVMPLQEISLDNQNEALECAKKIERILKQHIFGNQRVPLKTKKSKLFISHCAQDAEYVKELVQLLQQLGFKKQTMFCSSYSGYGIPLDEDIYDYLKIQFEEYELYVILVLSDHYYSSPACLNEMGAAWVLSAKQSAILLPGFDFSEIKGAVNPNKISIKLDNKDSYDLKFKLGELREKLYTEFSFEKIEAEQWERKRDEFIQNIEKIDTKNQTDARKKRSFFEKIKDRTKV